MSENTSDNLALSDNNLTNKDKDTTADNSKLDDSSYEDDNLCFNSKLLLNSNKYIQHKESIDSVKYKYSIDITTAPKDRLNEYLTNDLLNELDNNEVSNEIENNNETTSTVSHPHQNFYNLLQFNANITPLQMAFISQDYQQNKKAFEIREGDWTCFDCHNLNFSFRTKCNRCGIEKGVSDKKFEEYRNMIGFYNGSGVNYNYFGGISK